MNEFNGLIKKRINLYFEKINEFNGLIKKRINLYSENA